MMPFKSPKRIFYIFWYEPKFHPVKIREKKFQFEESAIFNDLLKTSKSYVFAVDPPHW